MDEVVNVDALIEALLDREGGYVDHPADKGGPTCFGITEAVARAHGYAGPMRQLPRADAVPSIGGFIGCGRDWTRLRAGAEGGRGAVRHRGQHGPGGRCDLPPARAHRAQSRRQGLSRPDTGRTHRPGDAGARSTRSWPLRGRRSGETVLLRALEALQGERYLRLAERRPANEAFLYGWLANRIGERLIRARVVLVTFGNISTETTDETTSPTNLLRRRPALPLRHARLRGGHVLRGGGRFMVALLMWGGWSRAEEHRIVTIFGWSLGGFIAAMVAVIVGLLAGGPVGRFKIPQRVTGAAVEADGGNDIPACSTGQGIAGIAVRLHARHHAHRPERREPPLDEGERSIEQLYQREQAAFAGTVANYRAAAETARAADQANAARVAAEQAKINEGRSDEFEARLAAARAAAERLRIQAQGPADPGARRNASVPGLSLPPATSSSRRQRRIFSYRRADRDRASDPARRTDQMGQAAGRS